MNFIILNWNEIKINIDFLRKKYKISSKCKIILSGIGQDILMNYLNRKFNNTIFLFELLIKTIQKSFLSCACTFNCTSFI